MSNLTFLPDDLQQHLKAKHDQVLQDNHSIISEARLKLALDEYSMLDSKFPRLSGTLQQPVEGQLQPIVPLFH
jgi:hypothetical protein